MVRTRCNGSVLVDTTECLHLIMGAVCLWTRLPALYLCTGPQKVYPTYQLSGPTAGSHRCMSTATSTPRRNCTCDTSKTCRAQQQACQRRDRNCNCGNHSFLHVWTTTQEAARPAQQGRRSLCPATGESLWSQGLWGSASA